MTENEIQDKLELVFREIFDDDNIKIHAEMTADAIEEWDSLMHIHLLLAIEKTFDVRFKTAEVMAVSNVGEFLDLLVKKCTGKSSF